MWLIRLHLYLFQCHLDHFDHAVTRLFTNFAETFYNYARISWAKSFNYSVTLLLKARKLKFLQATKSYQQGINITRGLTRFGA